MKTNQTLSAKITTTFNGVKIQVDDVWDQYRENIGFNGYDVACYISDGISVWPCGEVVDAEDDSPMTFCHCRLCERVRKLVK